MDSSIASGNSVSTALALLLSYIVISSLITYTSPQARYMRSLDLSGVKKQWFARWRASLDSLTQSRKMLTEGYEKFTKLNRAFALANFGGSPMMIVSPKSLQEVLQKPDDEVDLLKILQEATASKYTGANDIGTHPFHIDVVRHQLTRKLHLLTEDIHTELLLGFEDQWKASRNKWTTVPALTTCANIVSRAANRVFSGAELCRKQEFIDTTRIYGERSFIAGAIISLIPTILHSVLAPLVGTIATKHIKTCKKHAIPIIKQRIQEFQSGEKREPQHDAIDWIIEEAIKSGDPAELDPDRLCMRILRLNMAAIHTTSITTTNALLDLYSHPRSAEFVAGLREECERVLAAHDGKWTKATVNDLKRIDSTIKESMRVSSLGMVGVARLITKKDGIKLSNGTQIPAGVRVAAPNVAIHLDSQYYDRPDEYDAFRFSRGSEIDDNTNGSRLLEKKGHGIVTTSLQFMPFGHGRHACPGRFFASQEMKLMLAHIVMNYDVQLPGPRKPNFEFKGGSVPDPSSTLQIRLRKS